LPRGAGVGDGVAVAASGVGVKIGGAGVGGTLVCATPDCTPTSAREKSVSTTTPAIASRGFFMTRYCLLARRPSLATGDRMLGL